LHFIRRLIVHSQARLAPNPSHLNPLDTSTALSFRLLVQEIQRLAHDPFLADRFRDSIDQRDANEPFRSFDLGRFVERVGLHPLERFVLVSPFLAPSVRKEFQQQALAIIDAEFENAVLALCQRPSFDHGDITLPQTAKLLTNLLSKPPLENPVLDPTQRLTLVTAAHAHFGPEALSPFLERIFATLW
jgi:CCR4-NOT transcription complex subunit 1